MPSWLIEYLLLSAVWGTSFLFMHVAVLDFGVLPTAALRVGIAALTLLPWLIWQRQLPLLLQHWRLITVAGLLNPAFPFICYAYALQYLSTGLASILNATTPLFGAIIAWLWLRQRLTPSRVLGLFVGFVGVVALAWDSLGGGTQNGGQQALAVMVCLCAPFLYGLAACYTQRYLKQVPSLVLASGSLWASTLVLALPALLLWPERSPGQAAWLAVVCVGVMCTGFAYILFFRLLAHIGPAKTLTVTFLIPVFAILAGVIALNERLTASMLACAVVIVLGTALSTGLLSLRRLDRRAEGRHVKS
jgi:drug/metabolite transporter (DMT)-like permease